MNPDYQFTPTNQKQSLIRRTLYYTAFGLGVVIALATLFSYLQVSAGLRRQALEQLEFYIRERGNRESELFLLAEDNLKELKQAWRADQSDATAFDPRKSFDALFERHEDGTHRLRAEYYDRDGITGIIRKQARIDDELRMQLSAGYELLRRYGPAWRNRFSNLYLSLSNSAVLMYWPENPWGLNINSWEINSKLGRDSGTTEKAAEEVLAQWSNLHFDYAINDWMLSASLALNSGDSENLIGIDIPLNTLFERTLHQGLEGTHNMIIRNNGQLIAHHFYMDAILGSGGHLPLEDVDDADLKQLYQLVKKYWRISAIIDHPEKEQYLAVARLSGPPWYLVTVFPYSLINATALTTARQTLLLSFLSLVAGLLLMYVVLKRMIARPLLGLTAATKRLAAGDLMTRVDVEREDEAGQLAIAFNAMSSRLQRALVTRDRLTEAQERLRESEQRFANLFQHAPAAFTLFDIDLGRWVDVNENAERLYGYSREELLRIHPAGVNPELQPDGSLSTVAAREKLQEAFAGGTPVFEWEHIVKSGEHIQCEVRLVRYPSENRKLIHASIIDISDRKRVNKMLRRAKEEAEAASRAKSNFLANMSHELRTPLNTILGFTRLTLHGSGLSQEHQENLLIVKRSGEHLLELINDILEMSKVEAGRVELHETVFDLQELLRTLIQMQQGRADDKGLRLHLEMAPNLPLYIVADERKLRQVLINLLGNAIKFTSEGSVTLRAVCQQNESEEADLRLKITITDTGIGIRPEEFEQLFEPFVRSRMEQTTQEGTGLGLAISRQFVRLMGGDITVESEPKKGSSFQFQIQAKTAEARKLPACLDKGRVIGLEPGQKAYRILIVEDKAENRLLMRKLMESLGFEVREAEDGRQGVERFNTWSPDLVWMDMRMPVMDGYQATRNIKATPAGQQTTIIALTASAFEEQRSQMLVAGCDDFVRKPFQDDEILGKMEEHLGVRFIREIPETSQSIERYDDSLSANALMSLPDDWLESLNSAASEADGERIKALLDNISDSNAEAATTIEGLVEDFQFERILFLLKEKSLNIYQKP